MSKRVMFTEDDLKVIFENYMTPAGFLQEGQQIVGFEYRTRTIKKDGDFYKDVVPPGTQVEGETEEVRKIYVLVK